MKQSIIASAIAFLAAAVHGAETFSNAKTPPVTIVGNGMMRITEEIKAKINAMQHFLPVGNVSTSAE
jgi:hypothetical protein